MNAWSCSRVQVQEMARNLAKKDPSDPSAGEKGAKELLKLIEDVRVFFRTASLDSACVC